MRINNEQLLDLSRPDGDLMLDVLQTHFDTESMPVIHQREAPVVSSHKISRAETVIKGSIEGDVW